MKNLKFSILTFSALLFLFSCSDPCKDVDCNGGTCDEGICACIGNFTGADCTTCKPQFTGANCDECIEGFEGEDCLTEAREKFYGTYQGSLECDGIIDPSQFGFGTLTLIVEEHPDDIAKVTLLTPSLPFTLFDEAELRDDMLVIPNSQQEWDLSGIDIPGIPFESITVTTNGEGTLLSEDQMEVKVNFIVPIVGATSCVSILDRL